MRNEVKHIRLSRDCLGRSIEVEAMAFLEGVHVSVYGGDQGHIGAVSIVEPGGQIESFQFPGHRDAVVSEAWARALAGAGCVPAVVEAGIHYDGLSEAGIRRVLEASDQLLRRLLIDLGQLA